MSSNQFCKTSEVFIRTGCRDGVTELKDVYFTAPFKVMHPFERGNGWKEIMIMSVSAGIMAGDRQSYHIEIDAGSKVLITSQSYEKIHRMEGGFAQRETNIVVESDAILYYRPQPVIPFKDSDFRSRTKVVLKDKSSRLIMSDVLCSGRVAMGEEFAYRYYRNLVEIYKSEDKENAGEGDYRRTKKDESARENGEVKENQETGEKEEEFILSYRDNTWYEPQSPDMDMGGFGMYEGYGYLLNLLFCNIPIDKGRVQKIRSLLEDMEEEQVTGGVTYTWDGDFVVRVLGRNAEKLEILSDEIVKMWLS